MTAQGRVFVVDDEPAVRKAIERLLRAAGLEVRLFASGRELLAAIDHEQPGCLLLDYQMPDMNGLELQAALATRAVRTQIVFLTGHADLPESARAMQGGAVAFLRKPAPGDQLLPAVRSALARAARAPD